MKRLLSLPRWLFGYGDVPYMARPTFRYEMISGLLAAVGTGAAAAVRPVFRPQEPVGFPADSNT